jgi:hypothetical protein
MTEDELRELENRVGFDPSFPCIYCEQPVERLSCSGPMICPACDCGHYRHDHKEKRLRGKRWQSHDFVFLSLNARRRMEQREPSGLEREE